MWQGPLNMNIKKEVFPDGFTREYYDDTDLMTQMMPSLSMGAGAPGGVPGGILEKADKFISSNPALANASITNLQMQPLVSQAVQQQAVIPSQIPAPINAQVPQQGMPAGSYPQMQQQGMPSENGGLNLGYTQVGAPGWTNKVLNWLGTMQAPLMLGAGATAFSNPGSWQHQLGNMAMQWAQNNIFNQFMQNVLAGGQQNPFIGSSQALGPQGVGGLTPEMQLAVFNGMLKNQMQPMEKALMGSQIVKNLRPDAKTATSSQLLWSNNVPREDGKPSNKIDPGHLYGYNRDPKTGESVSANVKKVAPSTGGSGPSQKRLSISDIDKLLVDEFYNLALENAQKKYSKIMKAQEILGLLTDKQGTVTATRTKRWLTPEQKKEWVKRRKMYLGKTYDEASSIYWEAQKQYFPNQPKQDNKGKKGEKYYLNGKEVIPGFIYNGMVYLGGDPRDSKNWRAK